MAKETLADKESQMAGKHFDDDTMNAGEIVQRGADMEAMREIEHERQRSGGLGQRIKGKIGGSERHKGLNDGHSPGTGQLFKCNYRFL
jgi:hypothetical protein